MTKGIQLPNLETLQTTRRSTEQQLIGNKNGKKNMCEYFKWQTTEISHEKTWTWLRKENFKIEIKPSNTKQRDKEQLYQNKNRQEPTE